MSRLRILCPDAPFADRGTVERATAGPEVELDFHAVTTVEALPDDAMATADGLLAWHYLTYDAATMDRLPRCRAIMRAGVGFDHIDLEAAGARGIAVLNTPDYGTGEVADHAIAMLLAFRRGIVSHHDWLRSDPVAGFDGRQAPLIKRLRGTTLGIVGLGRIGTAFLLRARAFGFHLLGYDPYLPRGQEIALGVERKESLQALLAESEIVSLHCPLDESTRNLMDRAAFAALPQGALVINTARGAIVDLDALYEALKSGHLGGAGLDVLPQEPPAPDHPLIQAYRAREPWLAERLILSPHAAWYSPEGWHDMRRLAVERLLAYLREGDLATCVNLKYLRNRR